MVADKVHELRSCSGVANAARRESSCLFYLLLQKKGEEWDTSEMGVYAIMDGGKLLSAELGEGGISTPPASLRSWQRGSLFG